jgi:hypothetical protein
VAKSSVAIVAGHKGKYECCARDNCLYLLPLRGAFEDSKGTTISTIVYNISITYISARSDYATILRTSSATIMLKCSVCIGDLKDAVTLKCGMFKCLTIARPKTHRSLL